MFRKEDVKKCIFKLRYFRRVYTYKQKRNKYMKEISI